MLATGAEREFSTPSEYLQYVRAAYARPYTRGAPDPEMHRLARLDIEKYGVPLPDPSDPYRHVVRELADRAAATVMARRGVDITTRCAIGSLDEPSVNASCFRSANGFYAIVLHHGLMLLLHKHSKLLTAAVRPSSVVYCNRLSPSQLTPELLVSWAAELGQIYLALGEIKGAIVKLDQLTSESATLMLTLAEAFVLGHEIGHFLAGHLEDESRLVAHDRNPRLEFYAENSRHQDEFEADIYGFEVMRDYFEFEVPKSMLLGALVSTFEALSLAGAGSESASHPSAHDRIRNVADAYFSADTTELVRRSVAEGDHAAAAEALKTAH